MPLRVRHDRAYEISQGPTGMSAIEGLVAGVFQTLTFIWDSLFGLIFGFLVSAIAQVALTPKAMQRFMGPNLRGILSAASFGIIASPCSYGASAAARGFYQKGADTRSVFSFLIASTNMNVAIVILFWSLLGWRFAFAEFFGGVIVIAVVTIGLSMIFRNGELERLQREHERAIESPGAIVSECPLCGMEGEAEFAAAQDGVTYYACGRKHQIELEERGDRQAQRTGLRQRATWLAIAQTAWGDVQMLRNELLLGYLLAGFATALIPLRWFAQILKAVGGVPHFGYVLLLATGLLLAVITFVCSMGNVPVARFLANARIPLGANISFIYGDLLVPPLVAIYFKSFPRKIVWAFVGLFIVGALLAGGVMEHVLGGGGPAAAAIANMAANDRFTLVANSVGIAAVIALIAIASVPARPERRAG
jgi:uncharacterized membrane protein YraQ (UPF0718 family)